jgi:hypothetical protein
VASVEAFPLDKTHHLRAKLELEQHLKAGGPGVPPFSIVRPCAFFENLDDPANWNPLRKGAVSFLTTEDCSFCATYDIGRAAAVQFKDPSTWLGKSLDVVSWRGDLAAVAAALERVGGVPVKARRAMPLFLRRWLLPDLHYMCLAYEGRLPGRPDRLPKSSAFYFGVLCDLWVCGWTGKLPARASHAPSHTSHNKKKPQPRKTLSASFRTPCPPRTGSGTTAGTPMARRSPLEEAFDNNALVYNRKLGSGGQVGGVHVRTWSAKKRKWPHSDILPPSFPLPRSWEGP